MLLHLRSIINMDRYGWMDRARERMKLKAVKLNMVPEPKTEKGYISLGDV